MSVRNRAVVSTPVVHYVVCGSERAFAGNSRRKPGAGPSVVRSLPELVGNFVGKFNRPAFDDLKNRSQTFDKVKSYHRCGHFRTGNESRRITAAAEISEVCIRPGGCAHHCVDIFIGNFPPSLHNGIALFVLNFAASVDAARAGVDKVNKSVRLFGVTFELIARNSLYRFARPISSYVRKHLRSAR